MVVQTRLDFAGSGPPMVRLIAAPLLRSMNSALEVDMALNFTIGRQETSSRSGNRPLRHATSRLSGLRKLSSVFAQWFFATEKPLILSGSAVNMVGIMFGCIVCALAASAAA